MPDTVLFVGAGVSAWSGLPTWRALISELADFIEARGFSSHLIRRELEYGDLLQAASFGFEVLSPQDSATFLRTACRVQTAKPSPLHRCLAALGPGAFITTNYDKLLEQALASERPNHNFRIVNNVNQVETAWIIQSRTCDFVFKPHGDIDAADSVVLTREQYRELQHEKRFAFEAFKTLMASRPVLFVGFGLRDPDFLLIKDTLASIYLGAAQDHYALVPDVEDQEVAYWRNNYGIHLISYSEDKTADDPAQRHRDLLDLLNAVADAQAEAATQPPVTSASATLALLRQARRMAQLGPPPGLEVLPLAASPYTREGAPAPTWKTRRLFVEGDAVTGLEEAQTKLLLTGAPGAGKSFVVKAAVARLAQRAIDASLQEEPVETPTRIPVYVDLRDYAGDLWDMTVESLPVGFPLQECLEEGRLAFFIDGLNEVSAKMVEDNTLSTDLSHFLNSSGSCSIVLVTRFGEEHTDLELPEIALESIPRDYVLDALLRHGVPKTAISQEFLTLLERPVFYRACVRLELWNSKTPQTVYAAMIGGLQSIARKRFPSLDLMELFGQLAFQSIDKGDLLIPVSVLASRLKEERLEINPEDVVNWLLAEEMMIPRLGEKLAFFHHSVNEYLAAYELATRFRDDPLALGPILKGRRWDQVILLSLGFLEERQQQDFFDIVMRVDAALALRALAFVEHDWERWTSAALEHLQDLGPPWTDSFEFGYLVGSIRISEGHEPLLLQLANGNNELAGPAMRKTLELGGQKRIRRAIDSLFSRPSDYNWCSDIGRGLKDVADLSDVQYLVDCLCRMEPDPETLQDLEAGREARTVTGLLSGAGEVLGSIELDVLREEIKDHLNRPLVQNAVLDLMWQSESPSAIGLTADLLEVNPVHASVALYFQLAFREDPPDITPLRPTEHAHLLIAAEDIRNDGWALETLRLLAGLSDEWLQWVNTAAESGRGDLRNAILWHTAHKDDLFFRSLGELHRQEVDWSSEPVAALGMVSDLSWVGHEDLFMSLLRVRNDALAYSLIEGSGATDMQRPFFGLISSNEIPWWIEWLAEPREDGYFIENRLGGFIAVGATADAVDVLIERLATGSPREREILTYYVLGDLPNLKLSDLPPAAVDWAMRDLASAEAPRHQIESSLLAKLATEQFVERRLLPDLETATEPYRSNLLAAIRQAGERHRRRYVTTAGKLVE